MCLSPVTIPNQSRYISLNHRDSFLFDISCGHCAECASTAGNQWYYRAWYEYNDLTLSNGYALFDCLTYSPKHLPHLSNYWSCLPKYLDFPCFDALHLRNFLQNLYTRLERAGYDRRGVRYFLASEYGTDQSCTHRPHIHLMFYVHDTRIQPLYLSQLISSLWKYGRTDGVPYKSQFYVLSHNYIKASSQLSNKLRTCRYVTKYIQKSCLFQSELNKRVNVVMRYLANIASSVSPDMSSSPLSPEDWLSSEVARRERLRLVRMVNQFHRQSQHFGESALRDLDLNQLEKDGCLFMPDCDGVKIPIPLPLYYKRKLMQQLVEIDGARYWVDTDYGIYYKNLRRQQSKLDLINKYSCVVQQFNLDIPDIAGLVDYVFDIRGRIKGNLPESTLLDRLQNFDLYNYSTTSDKLQFGCRGLSRLNFGDAQRGYLSSRLRGRISLQAFIKQYCWFDPDRERELDLIKSKLFKFEKKKQDVYELKQYLKNVYKPLIMSALMS